MFVIGQLGAFEEFCEFISGQDLSKGTDLLLFWHLNGFLDVAVLHEKMDDFSKVCLA